MDHPYYPPEAVIANYAPNEAPTPQVIITYGVINMALVLVAYHLAGANTRFIDRFAASWFALCELPPPFIKHQ